MKNNFLIGYQNANSKKKRSCGVGNKKLKERLKNDKQTRGCD